MRRALAVKPLLALAGNQGPQSQGHAGDRSYGLRWSANASGGLAGWPRTPSTSIDRAGGKEGAPIRCAGSRAAKIGSDRATIFLRADNHRYCTTAQPLTTNTRTQ